MLFESTTLLLQDIVHSLESNNETMWEDHLEFGNQCVYELYQMSRPSRPNDKSKSSRDTHGATPFERAIRAIPHVKAMNMAIRLKRRAAAIESGRAAIAEMSGMGIAQPSALAAGATAGKATPPNAIEVTGRVSGPKSSGPKRRATMAKPVPKQASAASPR